MKRIVLGLTIEPAKLILLFLMISSLCSPGLLAQEEADQGGETPYNCLITPYSTLLPTDLPQFRDFRKLFPKDKIITGHELRQLARWSPLVRAANQEFQEALLLLREMEGVVPSPELDVKLKQQRSLVEKSLRTLIDWSYLSKKFSSSDRRKIFIKWSWEKLNASSGVPQVEDLKSTKKELRAIFSRQELDWKRDSGHYVNEVKRKSESHKYPYLSELKLMDHEKKGLAWGRRRSKLEKWGTSLNMVVLLKDEDDQNVAVFKSGSNKDHPLASAILEKLVWEVAVRAGQESYFSPIKLTELSGNIQLPAGNAVDKLKGGLQSFQKFILYAKFQDMNGPYNVSSGSLPKQEYVHAYFLNLMFGMFDAHAFNMGLKKNGKFIFFDNGRTLPNGNGLLNREAHLTGPFRSAFLSDDFPYRPLRKKYRDYLELEHKKLKASLPSIKAYLEGEKARELVAQLPPHWFNPQLVYKALEERVERMEAALASPDQWGLTELTVRVFPELKFIYALNLATYDGRSESKRAKSDENLLFDSAHVRQKHPLGFIHNLRNLFDKADRQGINVKIIYDMAMRPGLTLDQVLEEIRLAYYPKKLPVPKDQISTSLQARNAAFLKELEDKSIKDFRDR